MQLSYTSEELLADHDYARPHVVAGHTLHGGFDADGHYRPPRTLRRPEAVESWRESLRAKGGAPLDIGLDLLAGPRYPNFEQHKLLLRRGLGETLWSTFTNIGRTEGRGAMIAMLNPPSFQEVVDDDTARMTVGHLKPLFVAHGADEGGIPSRGIGGHDQMWFVARDLAFGEGRYPLPPEAGPMRRGAPAEPWLPELPAAHGEVLRFLMSLLMIEIRAFIGFQQNERLLRDRELFVDRREQADQAADIVARIRIDERVHVAYLCNVFGELRHATLKCVDGSKRPGAEVIDPAWERQVRLSKDVMPRRQRAEMREVMRARLGARPGGEALIEEFEALGDPGAFDA